MGTGPADTNPIQTDDLPEEPSTRSAATPWKVATAALAVVAVALGIWVFALNQDRQDTETAASGEIGALQAEKTSLNEQVADLTEQVADLEGENVALAGQSQKLANRAKTALTRAVVALGVASERLDTSQQKVKDATAALNETGQALQGAQGDLATAQAERDKAAALAENAQLCAAGSLKAVTLIVDDDVDRAVDALDLVSSSCEAAFDEANQPTS